MKFRIGLFWHQHWTLSHRWITMTQPNCIILQYIIILHRWQDAWHNMWNMCTLQGFSGFLCSQESPLQAALNGGCPFNAQLLSDMSHANVLTLSLKRCHYEFLYSGINVQHAILVIHAIESESLNLNVSRGMERRQSIQRRCPWIIWSHES